MYTGGSDCMKTFCESLRENTMKMINFKKRKSKLLTKEQEESYENAKICYICKERIENKYLVDKKLLKLEITVMVKENIEVLRKAYVIYLSSSQIIDSTRFMANS